MTNPIPSTPDTKPLESYACALVIRKLQETGTLANGDIVIQAAQYRLPGMISKNKRLPAILAAYQSTYPDSLIFSGDLLNKSTATPQDALANELEKVARYIQEKANDPTIASAKYTHTPEERKARPLSLKRQQEKAAEKNKAIKNARLQLDQLQNQGRVNEDPEKDLERK